MKKNFDLAFATTNETIGEENYILFVENNEIFVIATILNDYYFHIIYDYMKDIKILKLIQIEYFYF